MRFVPSHVLGVLDYLTGVSLTAAPWLFEIGAGQLTRTRPPHDLAAAVRT